VKPVIVRGRRNSNEIIFGLQRCRCRAVARQGDLR
jgi:hypothetical protein